MMMSKSEYARYRGVSRQTVYEWIRKGELIMSGSKIFVRENEQVEIRPEINPVAAQVQSRTLEMTWAEFWGAVRTEDGKRPAPLTSHEAQQRVLVAAGELNWSVEFLDDEGIYLSDGDTEYYIQQYDLFQNAGVAIGLIRREVCYTASACPDEQDEWSQEGIHALAEWAR
ncbi:helix-turn-helix domain-containing protein [Rahnella sp. CJA17(1/100)]|uniref:helix-turn-helix domain-containing protein n=1 Tax=Rahnella sp. CJA17(1/100) TaxID=2508951 RepID=UPI00106F66B1|nr:helix-turn-helix domain-containing protein [Rahnella sp. CJA17(1/100)]